MKYNFDKMPFEEAMKVITKIPDGKRKDDHEESMQLVLEALKCLRKTTEKEVAFLNRYVEAQKKERKE